MNTKVLMSITAILMGVSGLLLTFIPQETALFLEFEANSTLVLQMVGALYFGFAMLNWMSKNTILGGIYGKPIVIANFAHFFIAAMALSKYVISEVSINIWLFLAIFYSIFALAFCFLLFGKPKLNQS